MSVGTLGRRVLYGVVGLALLGTLVLVQGSRRESTGDDAAETATPDANGTVPRTRARSRAPLADGEARASVRVLVRGLALGETAPLPAADVILRRSQVEPGEQRGDAADERELLSASTDSSGEASFDGVRPGRWEAHARARGYLSARREFEVRAVGGAPHHWELTLEAHASIDLTVIGAEGGPVEGTVARVVLATERPRSRRRLHPDDRVLGDAAHWESGSDGHVTLGVVPVQEPFTLVADHPERGRFVARMEPLQAGEERSLRVVLEPHTVLIGSVARAPEPGVRVAVECWHIGENVRGLVAEHKAPASADRRFRLTRLAGGRKRIVYTASTEAGVDVGTLDVDAPAGVETDVGEIPVLNSSVRVLVVTDDDVQPLGEAQLSVIWLPADLDAPSMPVVLGVRPGREVVLRGFASGQLLLTAQLLSPGSPLSHPDYEEATARVEFDGIDARVDLVLARERRSALGEIEVRVAPPPGVEADALSARVYVLSEGVVVGQVIRAEAGSRRFGFARLLPGRHQVMAVANGFRAAPLSVDVEPDRVNAVLLERWVPAVPFEGRVTRDGAGVEAARVQLVSTRGGPAGPPPPLLEVLTDAAGVFRFEAVPQVADLELRAVSSAGASAPIDIDADGSRTYPVLELEDVR